MNDKEPTPIPLRAHRKPQKPIEFPRPVVSYGSNTTPVDANLNPIDTPILAPRPLVSPAMADFIHQAITKALYAIGNYGDGAEPIIAEMTYEQFEAFMAAVWEDE